MITYRKDNNRQEYLGASEAPALLGLSTWATPFDVWAKKTLPPEESTSNSATRRGHILEGAIFDWGAAEVSADWSERGGNFHSRPVQGPRPWAAFHPDGWLKNEAGDEFVVEVKTARDGDGWEDDGIPAVYAAQVRYQLACCPDNIVGAYVFAYITFKDEFLWRYVARDPAQEQAMLDFCGAWWERHVTANVPPAFDGSDGASRYLLDKHPKERTPLDEADENESALVSGLMTMKADAKALEDHIKVCEQELKALIGDREGVFIPEVGKATWKYQKGRAGFDAKRLAKDQPEIHTQYVTQGAEQRVLRLPRSKK